MPGPRLTSLFGLVGYPKSGVNPQKEEGLSAKAGTDFEYGSLKNFFGKFPNTPSASGFSTGGSFFQTHIGGPGQTGATSFRGSKNGARVAQLAAQAGCLLKIFGTKGKVGTVGGFVEGTRVMVSKAGCTCGFKGMLRRVHVWWFYRQGARWFQKGGCTTGGFKGRVHL